MSPSLLTHQPGPESLKLERPVPLTQHPGSVYLASVSEGSRPTMKHSLNAIAALLTDGECDALTLDWSKIRYQYTAAVRAALIPKYAPTTVNKMLGGLRRVLKEALRLNLIDVEDYMRAVDFPNLNTGATKPKGRALRKDKIADLMAVCKEKRFIRPIDIRDAALFAILRGTGVRREELVNFDLRDIVTVQKLAGHASPTTTAKYDRCNEEVKRAAVQKLEF